MTVADYVFAWNDWVVMPVLLIVAIIWSVKLKKLSLALLAAGVGICVGAVVVRLFYTNPLNLVHGASLIAQELGLLLSFAAFAWFWFRDRSRQSMQSNGTPHTDARASAVLDEPPPARAGERGR
jgi:hypothetical protein